MHIFSRCFVQLGVVAKAALALAILLILAILATGSAQAQTFTTLFSFDGPDGSSPEAGLIQATDGNLYGTTTSGGANGNYGTIFKITPSGTLATLYSFDGTDGNWLGYGVLVQATDGNFYGTTAYGGATGAGTVFKITAGGTLTTLYTFCSQSGCTDGNQPLGALIQATDGNFYGTTEYGGAYGVGSGNTCGTVFKITPSGVLTTLHSFDCTDGEAPIAGLIQATDGNFYGTTSEYGGPYGTVFKITPNGTLTTLYIFGAGATPYAGLIQATDGNFYGTTPGTGANGAGTVFKITAGGTLTTLYSFCSQSGCTDGTAPYAGLVQGTDGSFYGTTTFGGAIGNYGTIFRITPGGTLTTLYSFDAGADESEPWAGLVQDTNGNFYGTTGGWPVGAGTVFSLSVGLGPFVKTLPTSGPVKSAVQILGTDLTGATRVSFNGTEAKFKVASAALITTTVPKGASSGFVTVITPGGTLTSNVPFVVSGLTKSTTTLTSSPNPSTYGEAVTFTAVVTPAPPDGETVSFMKGKTVLGTGTLSGGTATFVTSTLKVGTTSVKAVYAGDSEFGTSKSKAVKQVVEKAEE